MSKAPGSRLSSRILAMLSVGFMALLLLVSCAGPPSLQPTGAPPSDTKAPPTPTQAPPPLTEAQTLGGVTGTAMAPTPPSQSSETGFLMFLRIDGIPGESTDKGHKDWIEILSYSHGVSQPAGGAASSAGGATAERSQHQDFVIGKSLDKASPKLALFCCRGTHIKEIVLELCRAGGDEQKFMEYRMSDVIVSSVKSGGSAKGGETLPLEEVSFNYGKISWTYTELDPATGKPKGDVKADWDLVANKGG